MLAGLLTTFRHELVSAVLVSAFLGVIAMPFKRIIKAYTEVVGKLDAVHTELTAQRTNCLDTLQRQGDKQVDLLGKSVDVLSEIRTDMKITLEHLRDKA
jgi:hypothetical protein